MYTVEEMKTLVNRIEWEQSKREFNKNNITESELELLRILLNKVNNIYGLEVRENTSEYEDDCLHQAEQTITDYLNDIELDK